MSDKSDRHLYHKYETLNMTKLGGGAGHSPPLSRATSPLNHDYDSGKYRHRFAKLCGGHSLSLSRATSPLNHDHDSGKYHHCLTKGKNSPRRRKTLLGFRKNHVGTHFSSALVSDFFFGSAPPRNFLLRPASKKQLVKTCLYSFPDFDIKHLKI